MILAVFIQNIFWCNFQILWRILILFQWKVQTVLFFFATYWSCSLHAILFTDKCVLIYFKNDKYQYQIHVYQWKSDLIQSTRMDLISLFGFTNTSKVEWNAHYQIMKKVGILTDNQMLRWALDNVCKSRGMSTLLNDFFHFSIPSWSEIQKLAHQITIANHANIVRISVTSSTYFFPPKIDLTRFKKCRWQKLATLIRIRYYLAKYVML